MVPSLLLVTPPNSRALANERSPAKASSTECVLCASSPRTFVRPNIPESIHMASSPVAPIDAVLLANGHRHCAPRRTSCFLQCVTPRTNENDAERLRRHAPQQVYRMSCVMLSLRTKQTAPPLHETFLRRSIVKPHHRLIHVRSWSQCTLYSSVAPGSLKEMLFKINITCAASSSSMLKGNEPVKL